MSRRPEEDEREGFLGRWSARKQAARTAAPSPEPAPEALPREAEPPPELPDPETLGREDDFSVFLKEGVPEALRRKALRRLWRLDPVFGHLDGLNDYDLDYTDAATVVANLKTLYQVGKGMVQPEAEEEPSEPESAPEAPAAASQEEIPRVAREEAEEPLPAEPPSAPVAPEDQAAPDLVAPHPGAAARRRWELG